MADSRRWCNAAASVLYSHAFPSSDLTISSPSQMDVPSHTPSSQKALPCQLIPPPIVRCGGVPSRSPVSCQYSDRTSYYCWSQFMVQLNVTPKSGNFKTVILQKDSLTLPHIKIIYY